MNDLVRRLSEGSHRVHVSIRPEVTMSSFRECLGRNYIHIKFPDTRGGTELGMRIDRTMSQIDEANLDAHTGSVKIVGELTLDYVPVYCVAQIDLGTFQGQGHLVVREAKPAERETTSANA